MVAQPEPPFGQDTLKVSSTHGQPGIVVYIRRRHSVEAQRVGIEVQPGGDDIGNRYPDDITAREFFDKRHGTPGRTLAEFLELSNRSMARLEPNF